MNSGRGLRLGAWPSRGRRALIGCARAAVSRAGRNHRAPRGGVRAERAAGFCPAGAQRGAVPPPFVRSGWVRPSRPLAARAAAALPAWRPAAGSGALRRRPGRAQRNPRGCGHGRRAGPGAAGPGSSSSTGGAATGSGTGSGTGPGGGWDEMGPGAGPCPVPGWGWGTGLEGGWEGTGSRAKSGTGLGPAQSWEWDCGTGIGLGWGQDWDGTRISDPPPLRPSRPPPARADGCSGAMPRR